MDRLNEENREVNMRTVYLNASYFPAVELLSAVGTAAILLFGGYQVIDGNVELGVLIAFVGYLQTFFDPIQQISQLYTTYQQGMAALDKIFDLLDTEPDTRRPRRTRSTPARSAARSTSRASGSPTADDRRARRATRRGAAGPCDIDLRILPGQTVALVGETGAGKSTLAKLVARFYDPQRGRILIDGHDVRELDSNALRSRLGIVPQEGFLFSGTIADNVAFGRPGALDRGDHARRCATVGGEPLVAGLPAGLDTEVGERGASALGRASGRSSPSRGRCWPSRGS